MIDVEKVKEKIEKWKVLHYSNFEFSPKMRLVDVLVEFDDDNLEDGLIQFCLEVSKEDYD